MKFKDVYNTMIEYIKPDPRLLYDTLNGDKRKRKVYARNILKPALALVILLTLCLPSIFDFDSDIRRKDADNTPRGISHITNSEYYNGVIEKILSIDSFTLENGYEEVLNFPASDPLMLKVNHSDFNKAMTLTFSKLENIKETFADSVIIEKDEIYILFSFENFTDDEIKNTINSLFS